MSGYTGLERKISRLLRSNPVLKVILKNIYTSLMRLTSINTKKFVSEYQFESVYSSKESFFGYYDKSPSNGHGLILFHTSEFDTSKPPELADFIEVNLQNEGTGEILWSEKTKAFNWQQGARLQWITEEKFIYNDFNEARNTYVSKVVLTSDLTVTEYDLPVQDACEDYILGLNYRRLATLRPEYGYHCMPVLSRDELMDYSSDGIWKMEFLTNQKTLLLSLADILKFERKSEFADSIHKVNHFQISPDGKRFIFLHRYILKDRRYDRLIMVDIKTKKMKLLADSTLVSHFCWLDNGSLAIYLNKNDYGECYCCLDLETLECNRIIALDGYGDGHPSGNNMRLIADTYPARSGMQSLFLVEDLNNQQSLNVVGRFYHPLKYRGACRCDLHPRYDDEQRLVFFDSTFSGKRQLYKLELK